MKLIAILIMAMLPIMLVAEEAETGDIKIPSNIEKLFDKSDLDNCKVVNEVAKAIKKRHLDLKSDIDKKLSKHKGLDGYNAATNNGASNEDIIASPLASEEIKEVAAIYLRFDREQAKSVVDYVSSDKKDADVDLFGKKEKDLLGKWSVNGSEKWEIIEGGIFKDLTHNNSGTWSVIDDKIVIVFSSGNKLFMPVFIDDNWTGNHQNGKKYTLIKED